MKARLAAFGPRAPGVRLRFPKGTARAIGAVARDSLREALRGRWLWMAALAALAAAAIAAFAGSLALLEEHDLALSFAAPLARLFAVLIVALSAISSVARERSDGTLLLALAAPMSRQSWLMGKTLGYIALAGLSAIVLALPVLLFAPAPGAAFAWVLSLGMELALVGCMSLTIGMVLPQIPLAVCALLAFYVLSRDLHTVTLLAERANDYSQLGALAALAQAVCSIFPRLDLFTRTEWLLGAAPGIQMLALLALQTAIYCALAFCAALLDLRRAQLG